MKFFRLNQKINEVLYNRFKTFLDQHGKEDICIIFDCTGGDGGWSAKIVNLMNSSQIKFYGFAYREVNSAAIQIFLSTHFRFGDRQASATIHRVKKDKRFDLTREEVLLVEKQILQFIAGRLDLSLRAVYKIANANDGVGTVITMQHPLHKKFFFNLSK